MSTLAGRSRGLRLYTLFLFLVVVLSGCMVPIPTIQPLTQIEPVDEVQTVDLGGAARADVRLRMLLRSMSVSAADGIPLLRGRFRYNVAEWAPNIVQEMKDTTLHVTVGQGLGSQIPLGEHADLQNAWDVELARGIPLDLTADIGTGEARLDLTGLSLTGLTVTSGSSDVSLSFGVRNPQPLGTLRLTSGAGKLVASSLGNANFDQLSVLGGAGSVDLDFSGDFQRSAVADVKSGAGRVTVRVPGGLGVRVTVAGTPVTGIDTLGFEEQGDKVYVNAAYGVAPLTLSVKITTGVGAVSLVSQ
ncbi:MAG: toast rack family protein [Anaerolineae bacterium]|jgi:hypothetical protein|nr:toast rack family protein [Anaerolineae bacterium]